MTRRALALALLLLPTLAQAEESVFGVPRGGAPVRSEVPFPVRVGGTGNDSYVAGKCVETWDDGGVIRFKAASVACGAGSSSGLASVTGDNAATTTGPALTFAGFGLSVDVIGSTVAFILNPTPTPTVSATPTPTLSPTPTETSTPSGGSADCTGAPELACLAGRAGGQTLNGSDTTGENLTLAPNSAGDGTGQIGLIDGAKAHIANNIFGNPGIILGDHDPTIDLAGVPLSRLMVYDNDFPVMGLWSDTHAPLFIVASFKDDGEASSISSFRGCGSSYATRTQCPDDYGLFTFGTTSYKASGDQTDTGPAEFGMNIGHSYADYVTGNLYFQLMLNDGAAHRLYRIRDDGVIFFGSDLHYAGSTPVGSDRQVQIQPIAPDRVAEVVRGAGQCSTTTTQSCTADGNCPGGETCMLQTADLTQWHAPDDTSLASMSAAGDLHAATMTSTGAVTIGGSLTVARVTANDDDLTIHVDDLLVALTGTISAAHTFTLPPAASAEVGHVYVVKDESGQISGGNTLTIAPDSGGETIDGAAQLDLTTNYGAARLYTDGAQWFTW